jgi:hypothetical protein
MSTEPDLILQYGATTAFGTLPPKPPTADYVLTFENGDLQSYRGRPPLRDRVRSTHCYVVDRSERRLSATFKVPAAGNAYQFAVQVEAAWKATDPAAVVEASLRWGGAVVLQALQHQLWTIARLYSPEAALQVEAAARNTLQAGMALPEGVSVLRVAVHVQVDEILPKQVLETDADDHDWKRKEHNFRRLQELAKGDDAMILLHLVDHPGDTGQILQMILASRERDEQNRLALLEKLLEHGMIQDGDVQPLRDRVNGITATPAVAPGSGPVGQLGGSEPTVSANGSDEPTISMPTTHSNGQPVQPPLPPHTPAPTPQQTFSSGGQGTTGQPATPAPADAQSGGVQAWRPLTKPGDADNE